MITTRFSPRQLCVPSFRNRHCRNVPAILWAAIAFVACRGSFEPSPQSRQAAEAGQGHFADAFVGAKVEGDSSEDGGTEAGDMSDVNVASDLDASSPGDARYDGAFADVSPAPATDTGASCVCSGIGVPCAPCGCCTWLNCNARSVCEVVGPH